MQNDELERDMAQKISGFLGCGRFLETPRAPYAFMRRNSWPSDVMTGTGLQTTFPTVRATVLNLSRHMGSRICGCHTHFSF